MYEEWKRLYVEERYSLNRIAKQFGTNGHFVRRRLIEMGVEINNQTRARLPFTAEHRRKISATSKGRVGFWKGKKMSKASLYKNMQTHLQWKVELDFLTQFEDVERLKALNKLLTRNRVSAHFDTDKYKRFVEKFYYDEKFIRQLELYQESGNKYDLPSLDHIVPLARGGTWDLDNLQIISWFDNRAKCDMTQDEYEAMKAKYWRR